MVTSVWREDRRRSVSQVAEADRQRFGQTDWFRTDGENRPIVGHGRDAVNGTALRENRSANHDRFDGRGVAKFHNHVNGASNKMIDDNSSFNATSFFDATPLEAYDECVTCDACGEPIVDEIVYYDGRECHYHEHCAAALAEQWNADAEEFAKKHCQITRKLPSYDRQSEFRCTPEEYENGERESYTPNAYLSYCRHGCTNYDELIKKLDREYAKDRVFYYAIRDHIKELLESHEDFMRDEELE